jgi:hypothetical protein
MRGVAFLTASVAIGCGLVVDPANGNRNGDAAAARSSSGGAAAAGSSSGGTRGSLDAGTVPAAGGSPLTEEEAACNGVLYPLVPSGADSGACEFIVPSAIVVRTRWMQLHLTVDGIDISLPFMTGPGDCVLNRDKGWYLNTSVSPPTIVLCPATCASVAEGHPLAAGCLRPHGDPTM